MTTYPKRLIEVDLPIARISAHARREKSIRHGHISTLHIWWARRPLAACRAVMCASLWPDPVDLLGWVGRGEEVPAGAMTIRPQRFLSEVRDQMARRVDSHLAKASSDSLPRLFAVQKDSTRLDDPLELRNLLLDFIADYADWDNSADSDYMATARALTQAAHEALGGEPGTKPLVVDPFAGGGSIAMEALRVGADAFSSDLNPVAVLINKVVIEYIPRYGQRLADEVRKWGERVKQEAEKELADLYPEDSDGATPIAYLWARTIASDAPGEEVPVEIPLMRSMWLCKKPNRKRALRWIRDETGSVQTEMVEVALADGQTRSMRRPQLEIFEPAHEADVPPSTVAKGSATCPVTGFTTPVASVRAQLASRHGGAVDARLLAVVAKRPGAAGREYRLPTRLDEQATNSARVRLAELAGGTLNGLPTIPDEQFPASGLRRVQVPNYGIRNVGQLFTPRQAVALATFARIIGESEFATDPSEMSLAVRTILALTVDKMIDLGNSLNRWEPVAECPRQLFARQSVPIVWDFAEAVSIGDSSGSWNVLLRATAGIIGRSANQWAGGGALSASALHHPLADDAAQFVFTDPPYYDSVVYAHTADVFYPWLRRQLEPSYPGMFATSLTPKADEVVVDPPHSKSRSIKDKAFFEDKMTEALSECRRVTEPSGIAVVVFAHQSTSGWEAMLGAVLESGWIVNASWPIDTEMATRVIAQGRAVLASSVHLVCRPRENPDGSLREATGEWREVLAELPQRIHEWMPRLAAEGVVGADAIFACLGPALEVFSRYSRVEKSSGEAVTLREYLEQVWSVVSKEALSMIFDDPETAGLEPDARLTAVWLWTLGASVSGESSAGSVEDESEEEDAERTAKSPSKSSGYALEFDAARKIAQGLGVHLDKASSVVEIKGDKARLLPAAERTRYLFGKEGEAGGPANIRKRVAQLDLFAELQEIDASVPSPAPELASPEAGTTVLDRVHQGMILFAAGRGEALKRFLVEDGVGRQANFWTLAQALSALYPVGSDDKRWVDGVLARKKGLGL